jgi:phage shock protein E
MLRDFNNQDAIFLLRRGALLLDIRTKEEYAQRHIKNAILIPTSPPPLSTKQSQVLNANLHWILNRYTRSIRTPIVVYCHKGNRAKIAKQMIQKMGYPNVLVWGGVFASPMNQLFQ